MGPPSAPIAALDALGARLTALLAAADAQATSGGAGALAAEDSAFWDALPRETARDVGVFVATSDASSDATVARLRALFEIATAPGNSAGVLRVAVATFHGLKVAKRWDVLQQASLALVDGVVDAIEQRLRNNDDDALPVLTAFYAAILLGYQHSGELVPRAQVQIATLAPLVAATGHEALTRRFLVAVAALVHCHCAYEVECAAIRASLAHAFSVELAHVPVEECEAALREAAWILPHAQLNQYLPTIEGKWVQDEFSSEQHASATAVPQNAGSVSFKKAANVVAYEIRATIDETQNKTRVQLDGALFRPLKHDGDVDESANWRLEGHWSQVVEPAAANGATTIVAPIIKAEPWTCAACTLSNDGNATKCATCGTDAPKNTSSQVTTAGAKTTNPAPFQAVFDADHTFMRVRWSRGEQSGVWLAKKENPSLKFDFGRSLQEASAAEMADSNAIPAHAYSPRGEPSRVLLLEKTYALSTYGEMSMEVWIQVESPANDQVKQTVISTGEFELFVQNPSGALVWDVGSGLHVVTTKSSLADGNFHHVALLFGRRLLQILIDGVVAGEVDRGVSDQTSITSRRSSWVSLGGCVSDDGQQIEACFHGVILDLRIWSDVTTRTLFSPVEALGGVEPGLIGYFPLVGNSHRILQDASKHDNHATVFGQHVANLAGGGHLPHQNGALLIQSSAIEKIPVTNKFSVVVGDFEISGIAAYADVHDAPALRLDHPSAVWHNAPVSISQGFRSVITLSTSTLHRSNASQLVFAVCEASYWEAPTMITEASSLGFPYDSELNEHRYRGSSLFVVLERAATEDGSSDQASIAVYIWKNRRPLQLCRLTGVVISTDAPTGLAVTYTRFAHTMKIEVLGSGAVIDVGVDIEAALEMQSSRARTGIVLTSPQLHSTSSSPSSSYSSDLTKWTFETLYQQEIGLSAVHQIYPRLKQSSQTDVEGGVPGVSDQSIPTISCTRTSSDGSAIEQATYGCQTCGIVHGAGLCSVCATACHDGHELVYMGSMITACACAMRSGLCKCVAPIPASDFPSVGASLPRVAQWYCNRCTVVNSADVRECTICSNTAPDSSVLGRATPTINAPESTSRALVLVPGADTPPAQVPSEWSCPACTYLNTGDTAKCIICDSARPSSEPPANPSERDGLVTLYNAAESQRSQSAPAVAAAPTLPWYCAACTMENKPADSVCFMCQTVRAVPVANPVEPDVVVAGQALPTTDVVSMATPMETDAESSSVSTPHGPAAMEIAHRLSQLHLTKALASIPSGAKVVDFLSDSVWDSTAGAMDITVEERAIVAQYVEGEYAEKDGYVRGLAYLSSEQWKLSGRFKKVSQSKENAVSLVWDRSVARFDGKWFRGDGSGEWKCLAAPLVNDFRGLAAVDAAKSQSPRQPFYSGLINMKQNLTNVCYQNSFLQSLFLTQAFRRLILSSRMEDYANMPTDTGSGNQGDVLKSVQDLFARLIASQRPELDSHALQRCLPATFQAGRQQDTSDFAHFLIDSLSQQLSQHRSTAHGIDNVFGGTQATILACKTCGKKSINREYFWEMLLNMIDLRYTPITSISAVSGISTEISTPSGYERINSDLNKDRNGVPYVYLCVKRKPEVASSGGNGYETDLPITDLVVKVVGFADAKPVLEGYERVELDLNIGGSTVVMGGKKQVYLFFRREPNGSPITDLQVIYGTETVPDGFKQIRVDLNQGEGTKVFLCYRCDMPITDMKIVNSGIPGYRMVDHVLNPTNEDVVKQYLAFKVGGSDPCITDLKLISPAESTAYLEQGWETLGSPSSKVEEGVAPDILVVRRGHGNPIFAVDVFRAPRQVPKYSDYEVIDLYGAHAFAPKETTEAIAAMFKGDWLGDESIDRGRKAVRIHSVSEPIPDGLVIKGTFEDKGEVNAIATTSTSSWSTVSACDNATTAPSRVLRVTGHWKSTKTKQAQLFDVELRPGVGDSSNVFTMSGTIGDGRGRPVAITGTQTSHSVRVKWPVSQIFVLRGDERVPEGVEVVRETCSGKTGNLLAQTQSPHTLYLAVKREEAPSEGYVSDVCVIYGEIDAVPENYTCVQATPTGHSANLNDGTSGVPIFICYRRVNTPTEKCLMDLALMWTSGAQADTLPTGFTKIQHTPLGMEANLNQGTTGVSIHLCFTKCDPADVVKPVEDPLNGEYEITIAPVASATPAAPSLIGKFIRLNVSERVDVVHTLEGKFGTVFHGYLPGMVRGTLYESQQRKKRIVAGVWMSDEQNASSMIDFVPPSFPFEWTLNEGKNELDGWWSAADDVSANASGSPPTSTTSSSASSSNTATTTAVRPWKLMKDSYVRIAFKKDYGTEWKNGKLISSERVWRHDVESMLSRFVASRTLGGDNLLSCSQCERKTESRTNTVVVAPPAHLILTIKRMFYDWAQQKTRKSLHDVTFPALLTLPALTIEEEEAVYTDTMDSASKAQHRQRQYGLYGVLVHSGLTANSGHYFSYCRESDDSTKQLHQQDSTLAPWIKFNDSRVERSSWAEINSAVSSSVSDTVYLLLYKRLSYEVPYAAEVSDSATAMDVEHTDDEDEAMLLAKAMALSMSAAEKKAQAEAEMMKEEETKTEEAGHAETLQPADDDADARPIDSAVVREVEAANAQFLFDTMQAATSAVHVHDLHAALALHLGLQSDSPDHTPPH